MRFKRDELSHEARLGSIFHPPAGYRVSYTSADAKEFGSTLPASSVRGSGSMNFSKKGELVYTLGSAENADFGSDWIAFSRYLQTYGDARLRGKKHAESMSIAKKRLGRELNRGRAGRARAGGRSHRPSVRLANKLKR